MSASLVPLEKTYVLNSGVKSTQEKYTYDLTEPETLWSQRILGSSQMYLFFSSGCVCLLSTILYAWGHLWVRRPGPSPVLVTNMVSSFRIAPNVGHEFHIPLTQSDLPTERTDAPTLFTNGVPQVQHATVHFHSLIIGRISSALRKETNSSKMK